MTRIRLLIAAAASMLGVAATHAGSPIPKGEEHWIAYSTTAISITGDIWLAPTRLKIGKHVFALRFVSNLPEYVALLSNTSVSAQVFQVTRKTDPELLNGNKLGCGHPATWIVVYRLGHGADLGMDVFSGPKPPDKSTDTDAEACGAFTYTMPSTD